MLCDSRKGKVTSCGIAAGIRSAVAVMFEAVILDAAFDARRTVRRVATYSQSPDHPILPAIPETEYLKGYAYEVVR